jgi:hypothetical protein
MMQKMQIYEHEVALTMDHYVSGNTYGFHADKIKAEIITLQDE